MSSRDRQLDELLAVHEIRQLAYKYALAHDSRDLDLIERIFVPGEDPLEYPSFNLANLRQIFPWYFRNVAGPTILFVANHVIDLVDDDEATGSVYCLAKLQIDDDWIEQGILYQDLYLRLDGKWLIDRRRHLLWYGIDTGQKPFEQDRTAWPASAVGRGSLPADFGSWQEFYRVEAPARDDFYAQPELPG